jgi:hypothetical protein
MGRKKNLRFFGPTDLTWLVASAPTKNGWCWRVAPGKKGYLEGMEVGLVSNLKI